MPNTIKSGQLSANKNWLAIVAVLIAFFALGLLLMAAGKGQNIVPPAEVKIHNVNVIEIEQRQYYTEHHSIVGRAEASQSTNVGFDSSGVLAEVFVDEGEYVKKGQVLATLNGQRLQARRKELQASLFRTEAEARIAKLSLTRVRELVEKRLESAQALDESIESFASADAAVEEMKARLNSLSVDLAKSKLMAPYDGQITQRIVDLGAAVNPGQALFTLQAMDALEVRMALATDLANTFSLGQQVELMRGTASFLAEVKSVAKQRQLATQTIDVIFMLVEDDQKLVPGDLLNIRQSRQHNAQGYWLPRTSLMSSLRGLWSVFVVTQTEQGELLNSKLVEVSHVEEDRVYVRGALINNDKVVVDGLQRLVAGQKVKSQKVNLAIHQSFQSTYRSEQVL
jgi:RND family efflux transporter MFP subunit